MKITFIMFVDFDMDQYTLLHRIDLGQCVINFSPPANSIPHSPIASLILVLTGNLGQDQLTKNLE
jgi:hypothetical protein